MRKPPPDQARVSSLSALGRQTRHSLSNARSVGAVVGGSDFAARVYAAINARDREAIKALSAPDIVVATTVETHRGREALPTRR